MDWNTKWGKIEVNIFVVVALKDEARARIKKIHGDVLYPSLHNIKREKMLGKGGGGGS